MIQRIQTIYLLLAAAATALLYKIPFLQFNENKEWVWEDQATLIFTAAAAALFFLSILLFKNRSNQMRLNRVAILFNLALVGYMVYWYFTGAETTGKILPGAALPFVSLVLGFLSLRNIRKDDNLVKSVDRLR